jgi:pilus assembly protein CpaE
MTKLLVIDDEPINHQLIEQALALLQWEVHFAEDGKKGIVQAHKLRPDIIITDIVMPDLDGYEVTRILRRESQFAATPILVMTAHAGLQDKLKSFEAGADDHLTKPFDATELVVRLTALLRRVEAVKSARAQPAMQEPAQMIAVHSLRGGAGSSTLAVNLGIGLHSLWAEPTILLDLTMTAGQVALMLNMTLKRTWADIAQIPVYDIDPDTLSSIIGGHESGVHFIAAPTFPTQGQALEAETLGTALDLIKSQYQYVVADLPHDFSEPTLQALDRADVILMVASPDMASIRAVTAALDTYDKLGYDKEKVKLVLNATFPHSSLTREKIESALRMPAVITIPYVQDLFVDAINFGQPPVLERPNEMVSGILEDFALYLSKDSHKKTRPEIPTEAWNRAYKRFQQRKK